MKKYKTRIKSQNKPNINQCSQLDEKKVSSNIDNNFSFLYNLLGKDIGLVDQKYRIFDGSIQAGIIYIESLSDQKLISLQVIEPLIKAVIQSSDMLCDILTSIQSKIIYSPDTKRVNDMSLITDAILKGDSVLFIDSLNTALIIGTRKIEKRAIDKPDNEVTVLASMDSFVEDLNTNCSLVIRRLPTPSLKFEAFTAGTLSKTKVILLWLDGITNMTSIDEARRRIKAIDRDTVDGIGVLSELIEDKPLSIFPKYRQTQRPDVIARNLSDGHFAILCEHSPFGFIAPISLWDNFKTMDDYSERSIVSSFLRLIRYLAVILSVTVSPLYVAFVTSDQIIVPPALAINIATGRFGVPFPTIIEVIALTLAISIIREASLRISGSVGFFVGTLAAIVIGQASVTAGYVSASVIIVVAISAISSFAVSSTTLIYPVRLINYFFIILAGMFGMFGVINGVVIVFWHLVSLESFGVPYLYPLVPFDLKGMNDTFIRARFTVLNKRLNILAPFNTVRSGSKPSKGD